MSHHERTPASDVVDASPAAGLIQRYDKHRRASDGPTAMDWIKSVHDDAIEYTGLPKTLRGAAFMWGCVALIIGLVLLWVFGDSLLWGNTFIRITGSCMCVAICVFTVRMVMFTFRLELFAPDDAPTMFDRRNRKVYRISRARVPGFVGLFKTWPLIGDVYDWNLIDCEHHAEINTTGTTAYRTHTLEFVVRASAGDTTVVDRFQLGNGIALSDKLADGVWEHIRRYMEENGPPLPPHQGIADRTPPTSWWQSMGAAGPFGPQYFENWRTSFGMTLFSHIALPIFLPMNVLWGTGNWLSYKTAVPISWPPEIQQAVGPVRLHG